MSLLLKGAAAIASTLLIAYGAGSFMSRSISTEIKIDAPTQTVWETLTDQKAIADWNPFIKKLDGSLKVGERLAVTIQSNGNSAMDFAPQVLVNDPGKELRWVGRLGFKGIFDGEHYYIMEETADGKTLFRHGENFSGMLSWVLFSLIGENTEKGFKAMNAALKERVEDAI